MKIKYETVKKNVPKDDYFSAEYLKYNAGIYRLDVKETSLEYLDRFVSINKGTGVKGIENDVFRLTNGSRFDRVEIDSFDGHDFLKVENEKIVITFE